MALCLIYSYMAMWRIGNTLVDVVEATQRYVRLNAAHTANG